MTMLLMLKGLPASGKTTYARDWFPNFKRVNKDDLRGMLDNGVYSPENEAVIDGIRDMIVMFCLARGEDIVSDDCNLNPHHEEVFRSLCKVGRAIKELGGKDDEFRIVEFETSADVCVGRDAMREHPIGEKAIRNMAEKYNWPRRP